MNGTLSTHVAYRDAAYLEKIERRLSFYAGSEARLTQLEERVCGEVETMGELVQQYRALQTLGAICRLIENELEDYRETSYSAERNAEGTAEVSEETRCIRVRDLLDERFSYVRAIYSNNVMTF